MDQDRIAGAAQDVGGKAESAAGKIAGDAATQASGRLREASGKVQNLYGQAKDAARDAADAGLDYVKGDGSEAVARLVRQNPVGSLLVAGAIGAALAMLLSPPAPRRQRRWRYYE